MILYYVAGTILFLFAIFILVVYINSIFHYNELHILTRPKKWRLWTAALQMIPSVAFLSVALLPDVFAKPGKPMGFVLYGLALYTVVEGVLEIIQGWLDIRSADRRKAQGKVDFRRQTGWVQYIPKGFNVAQIAFALTTIWIIF